MGQRCSLTADSSFYYTTNGVDPRCLAEKFIRTAIYVSLGCGDEDPVYIKKLKFISKESDWLLIR
jgi:hypothetical protein